MINIRNENMFGFWDQYDAVVNTVNTVGVMGKGVALEFKKLFPDMFIKYKDQCDKGLIHNGGDIWCFKAAIPPIWIVNLATKEHWRNPSEYKWIERGLDNLVKKFDNELLNIRTLAMPFLGCGNGGLNSAIVLQIIKEKIPETCEIDITIFDYKH